MTVDVVFEDVLVIADNGMALRCRVQGVEVWIGHLQLQPGTTVRGNGDRGRLVLKRWMLADLGLIAPDGA
ncbi:MAG TPA: hypothetical protein VKA21_03795 [Candidatus Binatia bacterium]|nr:hypothetical protein [Candidatus Binatia bacterium]